MERVYVALQVLTVGGRQVGVVDRLGGRTVTGVEGIYG